MAFLSPLFLAGAIAAAIPIVLHLLRREPEGRVKFAAVMMLRSAPVEHADKRRLRQLLLLALRVAALLLLSLAFARPFLASDAASAASGVTMVALDTSLSLSSPGQFARAQQLAKDAIGRAPSGHLVGVLTFADGVQIVAAPSGDRALAAAAVDAARPGLGSTRYRGALSAAAEALGGRGGTIVVVTDLQESGWDAGDQVSIPPEAHVEIADVGAPPPNLAVTCRSSFRRTDRGDDSQHRVLAAGRSGATDHRWRSGRRSRGIDRRRPAGGRGVAGGARPLGADFDRRSRRHSIGQRPIPGPRRGDAPRRARRDRSRRSRSRCLLRAAGADGGGRAGNGVSGGGRRGRRSSPRGMHRASRPTPRSCCCRPAASISAAASCWPHT